MDHQHIIEELEALRVRMGRHMMVLENTSPAERSNAMLCDLERMKQITGELEKLR